MAGPGVLHVPGALPGSVHDEKAGWIRSVPDGLEARCVVVLVGKGYQGSTWAEVPCKGKNKPEPQKEPAAPTRNGTKDRS